jgi:hypothetical protein
MVTFKYKLHDFQVNCKIVNTNPIVGLQMGYWLGERNISNFNDSYKRGEENLERRKWSQEWRR